jgi:DNA-binding MarR family transcriptional regulator
MKVQLNDYIALIREYNRIMNDAPEMKRLSLGEFTMICHLRTESFPVLSQDLVHYHSVSAATTSSEITRLAAAGYVQRSRYSEDARKRVVCITQKGEEFISEFLSVFTEILHQRSNLAFKSDKDLQNAFDIIGRKLLADRDLLLLALLIARAGAIKARDVDKVLSWPSDMTDAAIDKACQTHWISQRIYEAARVYALTSNGRFRAERIAERIIAPLESINVVSSATTLVFIEKDAAPPSDRLAIIAMGDACKKESSSNSSSDNTESDAPPTCQGNYSLNEKERGELCNLVGKSLYRASYLYQQQGNHRQIDLSTFDDCVWSLALIEKDIDVSLDRSGARSIPMLRFRLDERCQEGQNRDYRMTLGISSLVHSIDIVDYMVAFTMKDELRNAFAYTHALVFHLMNGRAFVVGRGPWSEPELTMAVVSESDVLAATDDATWGLIETGAYVYGEVHMERVVTRIQPVMEV